jgi:hypothetical protein
MAERELKKATGLRRVSSDEADVFDTITDHCVVRSDMVEGVCGCKWSFSQKQILE